MAKRDPLIDRKHDTGLQRDEPLKRRSKRNLKRHLAAQAEARGYVNPRSVTQPEPDPTPGLDALLERLEDLEVADPDEGAALPED